MCVDAVLIKMKVRLREAYSPERHRAAICGWGSIAFSATTVMLALTCSDFFRTNWLAQSGRFLSFGRTCHRAARVVSLCEDGFCREVLVFGRARRLNPIRQRAKAAKAETSQAPTPDVLAVNASDPVLPRQGGMSVAPNDPLNLQRHRRPASLGGIGRDPVWYIEADDLGPDLDFRQDRTAMACSSPIGA